MHNIESCPLCNARKEKQFERSPNVYKGDHNQIVLQCQECFISYLSPFFSEKDKETFYNEEFPDYMASRTDGASDEWLDNEKHVIVNEAQRIRRMKYLDPFLPEDGGNILDIGCSSGFMLYPLAKNGFNCFGIEPTASSREFVCSRGLNCFKDMEDLRQFVHKSGHGFDLITHFFVLDHVVDLYKFVSEQLQLLNHGGKLIIEVMSADDSLLTLYEIPNFDQFFWTKTQNYYFSQKSFEFFLKKFQLPYQILLDQRYDLSNHMVWARDGKPGGMGRYTEILGDEVEEVYKKALVQAGCCDTLIGILTQP